MEASDQTLTFRIIHCTLHVNGKAGYSSLIYAILHRDESTLPTGQSESLVYAKKSVLITDYAHKVTYSLPDMNAHGITKSTFVPLTCT